MNDDARVAHRDAQRALAAIVGYTVIACATSFVAKTALDEIEPRALIMLRLGGASVLASLALVARRTSWHTLDWREVARMCGLGVLGVTVNQALFLRGLAESTPARSTLLYGLCPLLVLLLGRLRGTEPMTPVRLAGIVLAFGGVVLVLARRDGVGGTSLHGDLILLGGALAWSLYTSLGKPVLTRHDSFTVTAVGLVFGTLAFAPLGVPAVATMRVAGVSTAAWASLAFLIVFSSVVAYSLWYFAIRQLAPSRVAVFMNLQPPAVVLLAWMAGQEPMTGPFVAGTLLVLAGVRLAGHERAA